MMLSLVQHQAANSQIHSNFVIHGCECFQTLYIVTISLHVSCRLDRLDRLDRLRYSRTLLEPLLHIPVVRV